MNHSFNTDVARKVGVNAAVILEHIAFWVKKHKADREQFYDGDYWVFSSNKALQELFDYMTTNQINYALKKLIENGYLKTGNYNNSAYNRTLWYALGDIAKSIYEFSEMDLGINRNLKNIEKDKRKKMEEIGGTGDLSSGMGAVSVFDPSVEQYFPEPEKKQEFSKPHHKFNPLDYLLALGVDRQEASDFIRVRKDKRATLTKTAIDRLSDEARKAGITLGEVISICCAHGWTGWRADWLKSHGKSNQSNSFDQSMSQRDAAHQFIFGGAV